MPYPTAKPGNGQEAPGRKPGRLTPAASGLCGAERVTAGYWGSFPEGDDAMPAGGLCPHPAKALRQKYLRGATCHGQGGLYIHEADLAPCTEDEAGMEAMQRKARAARAEAAAQRAATP